MNAAGMQANHHDRTAIRKKLYNEFCFYFLPEGYQQEIFIA